MGKKSIWFMKILVIALVFCVAFLHWVFYFILGEKRYDRMCNKELRKVKFR